MKKVICLVVITLLCLLNVRAQKFTVEEFRHDKYDLTANMRGTEVRDKDNYMVPLIKITAPVEGFSFEVGSPGILKTVNRDGEIWLYVPIGTMQISISHPQLGKLIDYDLGMFLEDRRTYKMKLTTDPAVIQKLKTMAQNKPANSSSTTGGKKLTITVGDVSFNMIRMEKDTFDMGINDGYEDANPEHKVILSSYYIGETEVTQELWKAVMGSNPSFFKGNSRPVEMVSWNDCQEFIRRLNQMTGKKFRLPTEAEWENAAEEVFVDYIINNISDDEACWHKKNSFKQTHPVKTRKPSVCGLYDVNGNVSVWCQDWYGKYNSKTQINPKGPLKGTKKVVRGGNFNIDSIMDLIKIRFDLLPSERGSDIGLRLAL